MSPLSLLFSSDEETSHRLGQTLTELEFRVEFCPEIFAAIDKLTSKSFDVIVCDWNEGPEAAFLIKTSRELKLNQNAFTIAIAKPEARVAAQRAGADLVLSKPVVPDSAKYALLTCDLFLQRMRTWLPRIGFESAASGFEYVPKPRPTLVQKTQQSGAPRSPEPSPLPPIPEDAKLLPVTPAFAFGGGLFGSGTRSILGLDGWRAEPAVRGARKAGKKFGSGAVWPGSQPNVRFMCHIHSDTSRGSPPSFAAQDDIKPHHYPKYLRMAALGVVFLAVGYASSEPLRSQGLASSLVAMCGRALERTQALLREDERSKAPKAVQAAQREPDPWHFGITRINVNRAGKAMGTSPTSQPSSTPQSGELTAQRRQAVQPSIPQSLRMSLYGGSMRSVATRVAPSLLAALEPIALPEELSERLILQKVAPGYPQQALKAGLQGSVVLQALIGRDGNIRDVKLIRGSFLLGKAAYQAVRQWRYQPWVVNGRAVEAETFVTVDFRLPQVSQSNIDR
jgi:TonB family protein